MLEDLKPCPFCGGKAVQGNPGDSQDATCEDCGARCGAWPQTREAIRAAWNRRAPLPDEIARRAMIRAEAARLLAVAGEITARAAQVIVRAIEDGEIPHIKIEF